MNDQVAAARILVIEDSHVQAKIISRHIEGLSNFETVSAHSLEEAEQVLISQREYLFAAVVDLNLPDAPDGEAVDLVQAHGLPAVVLTATFHDEVRDSLLKKNVADYVLKSSMIVLDDVVDALSRLYKNQTLKALVVDDSKTARSLVRGLLEIQNFRVVEAEDGKQALDILESEQDIVIVVTDYEMPVMDGFEFCAEVRKTRKKDSLAIVGVSGAGESSMTAKFLKHGANDFLTKPFEAEAFSWRINQTVEMLEIARELSQCLGSLSTPGDE
ncbi:response regulator [Desulfovibrio ferrophilus]|uniref:Response regulator receiver protein n=1 Tax=Desulfovibrio ferrophilus TaxID=241368 RepID=A0A2Z6B353_9BACT|nr:response regulator [Desulfovibrio ferrophilus]BBD09921.1 response regulator receiver protein [Desulfovibrio ferrophilus]